MTLNLIYYTEYSGHLELEGENGFFSPPQWDVSGGIKANITIKNNSPITIILKKYFKIFITVIICLTTIIINNYYINNSS